ncbi:hypothetical protein LTR99_011079 [Exophiala xenobiotica]|uniref:Folylpolyglutamate synthase n=1 Tax=Vermiconidia calcicola TaxID=1690605 RepID=A0AAV9PQB1_9PEZI|nr:hypothetical protein LTR99_011079 [Exophiala xenobiotica]KAK5401654.1 hypothetical protein LTR06_011018 [Exophiala xenobiotica]KAK5425472.1 hypothetical protein LTR34_011080 [Exophiala xenobiotica]KAK5527601.1 hypothetical protein LTR25_011050 [Vermiconidia calcicola]KAK5529037.1 hypothetical protein LTR23_010837 [Chaetothyriales sp. CCFEE 6169]
MERNYWSALRYLNGRKAGARKSIDEMRGSDDMIKWLELIGHSVSDLDKLRMIHVSGTKGKGSTCAFASSLLLAHGEISGFPRTIGLYSSPHMRNIRERIRINNKPISEELFTKRFFEVWDKLPGWATPLLDIPRYLQLLTLVSYHVFITEKVDVAIYETHLGGEFDATNVVQRPIVTAVTSIAMDHVHLLGPTIENIAWHKSGIFKPGSLAFSAFQPPAVAAVLGKRAVEKNTILEFVDIDHTLPADDVLRPCVQRQNCSLALTLARNWLRLVTDGQNVLTSQAIENGVKNFCWPGRFEIITEGNIEWYLDGAHNESSLSHAVQWYAEATSESDKGRDRVRILIFSHFSQRDGTALLRCIAESMQEHNIYLQHIILTSYDERRDGNTRIDRNLKNRFSQEVQNRYAKTWKSLAPHVTISSERTIEEALGRAREIGKVHGAQALITGSLHLVSGALCLLDPDNHKHSS